MNYDRLIFCLHFHWESEWFPQFKWLTNYFRKKFIIIPNLSNAIYHFFLSYPCLSIFLIYTIFSVPLHQLIFEWLANGCIKRLKISLKSTRNHNNFCFGFFNFILYYIIFVHWFIIHHMHRVLLQYKMRVFPPYLVDPIFNYHIVPCLKLAISKYLFFLC